MITVEVFQIKIQSALVAERTLLASGIGKIFGLCHVSMCSTPAVLQKMKGHVLCVSTNLTFFVSI